MLVGIADRRGRGGVRRRAQARAPTSRPSTTARPADGRSSPATTRTRVDLPAPLGPSTTHSSPRSTASVSPRSAATPPSSDGWTTNTSRRSTSGVIHRLRSAPGPRGSANARRVVQRTSAATATAKATPASDEHERLDGRHERRLGRISASGDGDDARDEPREEHAADDPAEDADDGDERGARRRRRRRSRRRRRALRLEVDELAAVVAQVGADREDEAEGRRARARRSRPRRARGAFRGREGPYASRPRARRVSASRGRRTAVGRALPRPAPARRRRRLARAR